MVSMIGAALLDVHLMGSAGGKRSGSAGAFVVKRKEQPEQANAKAVRANVIENCKWRIDMTQVCHRSKRRGRTFA